MAPGQTVGWVATTAVSSRCVYAGVIEHFIYVHPDTYGRGIASALLNALIGSTAQSATRHHIGRHHGQWRDVVFIERRSSAVGASAQ